MLCTACTYLLIHKTQVYLFCRSARRLPVFSRMIFCAIASATEAAAAAAAVYC